MHPHIHLGKSNIMHIVIMHSMKLYVTSNFQFLHSLDQYYTYVLLYANTSFEELQNNFQKYEFQKGAFQILASISSAELELLEWQWLYFAHNSITVARRKYEITSSRLLSKIWRKKNKEKEK